MFSRTHLSSWWVTNPSVQNNLFKSVVILCCTWRVLGEVCLRETKKYSLPHALSVWGRLQPGMYNQQKMRLCCWPACLQIFGCICRHYLISDILMCCSGGGPAATAKWSNKSPITESILEGLAWRWICIGTVKNVALKSTLQRRIFELHSIYQGSGRVWLQEISATSSQTRMDLLKHINSLV